MDWYVAWEKHEAAASFAAALSDFLWRRGYWLEHAERVGAGLAAAEGLSPTDPILVGQLLHGLARVASDRGEMERAESTAVRALALAQEADEPRWQASFLNALALILVSQGKLDEARGSLEESLPLFRKAGDPRGEGMALHNLGVVEASSGDAEGARGLYEEALPIRERAGDVRGTAETQNNLALLAEEAGQLDVAEGAYREALRLLMKVGDVLLIAVALCNLGEIALRTAQSEKAVQLLAPAAHTLRHLNSVHAAHASQCLKQAVAELKEPPETTSASWRQELMAAAELAAHP